MMWVTVRVYEGWDPFRATGAGDGRRSGLRSWDTFGAVLVCVLTGLAGIYYAFFSCFLLMATGVRVAFRERRWGGLLTPALLVACVAASTAAGLSPALVYQAREGKNPKVAKRLTVEAEVYGLKASEMLMPAYQHRLAWMRKLRAKWFSPYRPNTGSLDMVPLGVLGSVGFLYLIGRFLWWRPAGAEQPVDGLAYLNVMALVLASVGGVGAFFNHYVSPLIRCYDRISILIAFFSLAALFLSLGSVVRAASRRVRFGYLAVLAGLFYVGMYDQTAGPQRTAYPALAQTHASDRDFGRRMEAALPPGSMVYQMPYIAFPEGNPVHTLWSYEQFRPYFHTRTLRWSHGAIAGRASDGWLESVSKLPLPEALERLALAGFKGIHLDRRGFVDSGAKAEAELARLLGGAPLVSRNGLQTFFDMTRYVQDTHDRLGDREWEQRRAGLSVPAPVHRP
jgi:phosphoglycerol transferase